MVLESTREQIVEEVEEEEKRVIIAEEKVRVSEPVKKIKRRILKVGSEGDDVQALQVCSQF